MKQAIKYTLALVMVVLLFVGNTLLLFADKAKQSLPTDKTEIYLYGEIHSQRNFSDLELKLWKEHYRKGVRHLFIEAPYYTAAYLNLWMKEKTDDIIDQLIADSAGSLFGRAETKYFFKQIKKTCPETIFYGTDVGHYYVPIGERYLAYLEDKGQKDSQAYRLTQACIQQGIHYYQTNSIEVRENDMVKNFIEAYHRSGSKPIMGIYGGYHTDLSNPDVLASRLKKRYGNRLSSIDLYDVLTDNSPYQLGLSLGGGFLFLLWWLSKWFDASKKRCSNQIIKYTEIGIGLSLFGFTCFNPIYMVVETDFFFDSRLIIWIEVCLILLISLFLSLIKRGKEPMVRVSLSALAFGLLSLGTGQLVLGGLTLLYLVEHILMYKKTHDMKPCVRKHRFQP